MSAAAKHASYRDYRNAVEGQIEAGFSFGQVEDFIDACPIDEDQKAALWLGAWLRRTPGGWRPLADVAPATCGAFD